MWIEITSAQRLKSSELSRVFANSYRVFLNLSLLRIQSYLFSNVLPICYWHFVYAVCFFFLFIDMHIVSHIINIEFRLYI